MQKRVRVRRDRPSALAWALAMAVTMLAVYLITLGATGEEEATRDASAGARITREIELQPLNAYFADLGVYADEWQARVSAAEYAGRGAAAVVYADGDGFHVLGAGYVRKSDAERIASRLSELEDIQASVLALSGKGRSLRITAPEQDVEAVVGADQVLRTQLDQISALALQVDRGETSIALARTLAKVAASELRSARKRLERGAGADQSVCAQLISLLLRLEEELAAAAQKGLSAAELSGRLRCCHVDGTIRLIELLNGLGKI